MKRFKFRARDKSGKEVRGEVEATSAQAAAKLVRAKEMIVISISPVIPALSEILTMLRDRITLGDVATFTRQLSTMITAGLPLTEGLLVLRNQTKGSIQKVISQILSDVESGESLSASMTKHPKVFSTTYIALIKAGETGGVLDKVLARLSENLEKQQEFSGRVKGALIYPVIIVIGMVVVSAIMMIFVIPKMLDLYSQFDAELPLPTRILMGTSGFAARFWPLILAAVIGGIYGFILYNKTPAGGRKINEILFSLPIVGELQKKIILTDLTRTLSLMVGAGVSILDSVNIIAQASGSIIVDDALKDCSNQIEKGFPVAFSFARHPEAFPFILSQMIAVGEETGKMDEVLAKVSHIFEVESNEKVKALVAAIEPMIMVVLGLGVAFLMVAVIMPIYNLTSAF